MKTEKIIIEESGIMLLIEAPTKRSQYLEDAIVEDLWRANCPKSELGRKQRTVTINTYLSSVLRGRAKNWIGKYADALRNAYAKTTVIADSREYVTVGLEGIMQ